MSVSASIVFLWFTSTSSPALGPALVHPPLVIAGVAADVDEVDPPYERPPRGWGAGIVKDLRRWFRGSLRIIGRSLATWWNWLRRASKFILIALLAALFDRKLIAAWRSTGLQALSTYLPLMLYSYVYLVFDRRTMGRGKVLLVAALGYGVFGADLMPDRNLVPGLLDDTLGILGATWLFLAECPARVVDQAAVRALAWRQRVRRLRRAFGSKS